MEVKITKRQILLLITFLIVFSIGSIRGYNKGHDRTTSHYIQRINENYLTKCYILLPKLQGSILHESYIELGLNRRGCDILKNNLEKVGLYDIQPYGAPDYVLNQSSNWTWGG